MNLRGFGLIRIWATLLIATVIAIPVGGIVTHFVGSAAAADEGGTLRMGFMQKVDSMNPNVGLVDAAYVFYGLVYDTLTCIDEDMNIVNNLLTYSGVDPDYEPYGSVWTMDMAHDVKWHDGEDLTVDDFVYTINLNCQHYETMWAFQPYAYFMNYAEAVDEDTFRVHFFDRATTEPMPAAYAEMICIYALPQHLLEEYTATYISFNWQGVFEDSDPPIVGTGPFMATDDIYDQWIDGDKLTLERNPNYHWEWTREPAGDWVIEFDKIEMVFFDDATAMAIALENGNLDIAQFPPPEYRTMKNKVLDGEVENIVAHDSPKCTQYWTEIGINQNNAGPNPSRLDPVIRHAMAMATDKEYIVNNHYLGFAEPGTTLIPPVNEKWHYEPTADELFVYDKDAAAQLLEDGGYRYTPDSPNVRVATSDSYAVQAELVSEGTPLAYEMAIRQEFPEERLIAQYIQGEWGDIGISMTYNVMTEAALGNLVYSYAYDTMIWYWSADVDPMYQLFCLSTAAHNGWNDVLYNNASYEENFFNSVQAFDEDDRKMYVDNCQRVFYDDAHYIILAYVDQTYAWRTDTFEGWGDWEAHPGRSVDNFWSGNPLYFDLEYIGGEQEPVPWLLIGATLGVIVAIVVAAVVLVRMRGKKKGKKEKDESSPIGE